jgi:cysteine desulfuration protein SufE
MLSINEIQDAIIEEFSYFDQWMDKYEYLIDIGKKLPLIDEQYKTDAYLIPGCQSQVWLHADRQGDDISYTADSDAVITRGLISLLIRVLSGQTAEDISQSDLYFIARIGLDQHLSPTRSNGLLSMVNQMKRIGYAL